jgi:hypothetical protein
METGFGITSLSLGDPLRGRDDQAKPGQLALDGFFVFRTFSCEHDGPKNKKTRHFRVGFCLAEDEGFEPPVPRGTTVFKTAAFDRSANPPVQR